MLYNEEKIIMTKYGLLEINEQDWRNIFNLYIFKAIPLVKENVAPKRVDDFLRDLEWHKNKVVKFYAIAAELGRLTNTKNIADDLADFLMKRSTK